MIKESLRSSGGYKRGYIYYIQKNKPLKISDSKIGSVILLGFEPKTHSLEGCCSIQLSYRTLLSFFIVSCKT